jgi:hypothetical protein
MKSSKRVDLPPAVTGAFVKDMRACFAEQNQIARDASLPDTKANQQA